ATTGANSHTITSPEELSIDNCLVHLCLKYVKKAVAANKVSRFGSAQHSTLLATQHTLSRHDEAGRMEEKKSPILCGDLSIMLRRYVPYGTRRALTTTTRLASK